MLLALADVAGGVSAVPAALAQQTPEITLNGTVDESTPGHLNSKSVVLSSGAETRVNYRLVPGYAQRAASGVVVKVYMPSLEYVDGDYRVASRDRTPTGLGVQGRVSAGGGWNVLSNTTVQGGPIVMEYDGDLRAGTNPAFDIFLTTYNDGSDGPYGGVPEGTAFELNGYVSYETFDRVEGSAWETPNQLDDESRISVISSDLTWETTIESYVPGAGSDLVPIWDRYQYIDYMYAIANTSDNLASNVDGYSVTFDIDSTDTLPNGIIPFDINRWSYVEGGDPVKNSDQNNTAGQFVGVPGEGGILIYDVTDWDGVSELTDEIPYVYSGSGMIEIDRQTGANKQGLTPEGAAGDTERRFLVSLPLSRQGFPNPPATFKVSAITNVLFAKTANWSKTRIVEREIVAPTYDFLFTHTTKQPEVVYGYETYNEITDIRSDSNAPTFDPSITYEVDQDFALDRVTYEFHEADADRFKDAAVSYTYTDPKTGDEVTEVLTQHTRETDDATGAVTLVFDVSKLAKLDWKRELSLTLVDRVEPGETIPVSLKVFGEPYRVGDMTSTATATFVEKIASNDDFGENTSYTEVEHETTLDATFKVIYPKEVVPRIDVTIDGKGQRATVPYSAETTIDVLFGVNDTTAQNSTTTLELNASVEMLQEATLTVKAALFAQAENVRVSYTTLDSDAPVEVDLSTYTGTGDFEFTLPERVANIIIDTDAMTTNGAVNFVSISAKAGNGLLKKHEFTGHIRTYQPKPYDKEATAKVTGTIDIQLPNELLPVVDAVGVYGSTKTKDTTPVGYESTFAVEYQLDTGGVNAQASEYVIDMLAPTKSGALVFNKIVLQQTYLDAATDAKITFVDRAGNEQAFTAAEVALAEVMLTNIDKIVVSGADLLLQGLQTIAIVEYDANIEIGSSQNVRATFTGTPELPYVEKKSATKQNQIMVRETKTGVKVEGVNQVTQDLGVGNKYSVDIYRWWNRGYTYNTQDYTLDQGYKSLGGFTSTLTRPTAKQDNNNQRVSVDVTLPYEHFDLYYVKIRDEMKPFIQSVDLYRIVNGKEELWKTVEGSQWVDNSQEEAGYWRINTARPGMADTELFATYDSVAGVQDHPYYKDAWDADVRPEAPVSRVEVNLTFTRDSNDAVPQMAGVNDDIVEYMGRFHSSSISPLQTVGAKKTTGLTSTDTFGLKRELTRSASTSINSLVGYPFAQTRTGAHDNTSLANKVITMGSVGEYLASIWNANTASWPYYNGHGPDVYTPAATEYDEWLGLYDPSSFHDELIYEFVYPASPSDDPTFHLDPTHVVIEATSTLPYLTGVRVLGENGESVALRFDQPLTQAPRFGYDNSLAKGIHDDGDGSFTISFGEADVYPAAFEATFSKIAGFGERTAELDGVAEDRLGAGSASAALSEVDLRVGGVVNGNKALKGTTNLYRLPDDASARTLMHTTSATLTGYTPKLGASLDMTFDSLKAYDYGADGVTPNTSRVEVGITNSSEADIKTVLINVKPDAAFRSQLIEIPADIFKDSDWSVESVTVSQGSTAVDVDPARFSLNSAGNYEFNLQPLFDSGALATEQTKVTLGGAATLLKQHVDNIAVTFVPKDDTVRLWGSLAEPAPGVTLPKRMRDGANVLVSGVWVDADSEATGHNWDSKPTFMHETQRPKGSHEQVMYDSTFTANAQVTTYQPIFVTDGTSGNRGQKPTLTHTGNASSSQKAPRLYTRVARLQTAAVHMNNDFTRADATHLFYDADTNQQIDYRNIAVGDTVKVLYELRNVGTPAPSDTEPGSIPVFKPQAHIEAPAYLEVSAVEAATDVLQSDANRSALISEIAQQALTVEADDLAITQLNPKRADIEFDLTLESNESVFFYVEFTATGDGDSDLNITQGKTPQWNVYTRPAFAHRFMSYNSAGVNGNRVTGATAQKNYDGDPFVEHLGLVSNHQYKFADPNQLRIESKFNTENVSGEDMTLTVKHIKNEILHDNTRLDLFLTLDTLALGGFELTKFPSPTYPEGFTGEFGEPRVYFQHTDGEWINAEMFDRSIHKLSSVNELRIEYGIVPAVHEGAMFEAPQFTIAGRGHWQTAGDKSTKSYNIISRAQTKLNHLGGGGPVAEYRYHHNATSTAWKAIPTVEFNIQSFDSLAEAQSPYNGAATGKTGYVAGDQVHYRLTAKNHSSFQGTATNTPYGKAPLKEPVILDKIPEYLTTDLSDHVSGGVLDVERAIAEGKLTLRVLGADGEPRTDLKLPRVTVRTERGLDIAGSQQFANDRHNDGWGLLSSQHPSNTGVNPAAEIEFSVFTYSFEGEQLGRGEQLEIIYTATARKEQLPIATYKNGKSVFAPFFGWYGSNVPVANSAKNVSMDMASLLHDAGISGDRGHEMTGAEFLSNSYSWQPGANNQRRYANSSSTGYTQVTFYDSSADKQKSHTAHLRETAVNDLYTSFASSTLDENFAFAAKGRVSAEDAASSERILWSQDGMQLNRAWLYGASEMLPDTERAAWGTDAANFYEHDKSLNSYNRHRLGFTPYVEDDYTYAVQLHEEFTVRLHGANLGDRPVENGLEYTEILPLGITPYNEQSELLGITAFDGAGTPIDDALVDIKVVQSPENDKGYRAPAQSQEAGTYADTRHAEKAIPYVVRVRVKPVLPGLFNSAGSTDLDNQQRVDIRVRVYDELAPSADGLSIWHDEFTLTTIEDEEYVEIYSREYGAFNASIGTWNTSRYPNDGMAQGLNVNDLVYDFGSYTSYYAVEPWGMYVRGLNAQATDVTTPGGKPTLVTGDQIAMRKPTLRVWSKATKDEAQYEATKGANGTSYDRTLQDFSVDLYEEFTIESTVENQQLEVLGEYNRVNSGYNRYSGDNYNADIWVNAPQTIGGARGSWFEPTVTIALPYGVVPVMQDGSYARYYSDLQNVQDVDFAATVNDITFRSSTPQPTPVTEFFDVRVELLEDPAGQRFVMHFTVNEDRAADIAYGESLVISPKVVTIDTPAYNLDTDDTRYQEVVSLAGSKRPVFNPIVSNEYQTGATPSLTARDQGVSTAPNNVKSSNGLSITVNDRTRRDSTSIWSNNMGALKITERLISPTKSYNDETDILVNDNVTWHVKGADLTPELTPQDPAPKHQKSGAYGGTKLNLAKPSITNTTRVANYADSIEQGKIQVDAAGKYWYSTEVTNAPTPHANPYEELKTAGDVHNSRFLVTHYVTNFARATDEVRIKLGDDVYDREAFEALGYSVTRVKPTVPEADPTRSRIQWLVTTPANDRGTRGELKSGDSFTLLYEAQLVEGFTDNVLEGDPAWSADELVVDSYVSLISDDKSLIEGAQRPEDFIVQSLKSITYHEHETDHRAQQDIDSNGDLESIYAMDDAEIEILKPKAEVRVNTTRPRIAYSNGLSGDTYFNSSDTIEYLVTHAQNTGSGLKEFVVENILPTDSTDDSTVSVSNRKINTTTLFVSSGTWALPQETLDRLAVTSTDVDDVFKTFVYISNETAEDGYEAGDWTLLNPGGTSIDTNERFDIPGQHRLNLKKIRVVVKALDPDNYLVPQGLRLDVDADPELDGKQSVLETDPTNQSTSAYPDTVTDVAIKLGVRVSSDAVSTLFVYDTAQVWGNYVGTSVSKLAQSESRSYLTPSRPVVNVNYEALYYRSDTTRPADERFGWSDVLAIAPKSSPHLKFTGEFINADDSMWSRDEDNIYSEDMLMDPFVTFQLPAVMESGGQFTYVPQEDIDAGHPLSSEHRSRYPLTDKENNLWTWKLVRADGTEAHPESKLKHTRIHAGPWDGLDRNVVSVWFEGDVFPGDKVVVEFIGSVDAYSPGADAEDLKSRALITNSTGLLHPLNSRQNAGNKLGYSTDNNDFNENDKANDRLVFSEKTMFQYETFDNFGKRKVAYSDLNRAGTVAPHMTPVREGGDLTFEISVDNSKEADDRAYPYPIMYDVLPHLNDTSMLNAMKPRESKYSAWLQPEGMRLELEGVNKKVYAQNEYTVYVGPLRRQGSDIVDADMVAQDEVGTEAFYDSLGVPGQPSAVRDAHFVKLSDIQSDEALLKRVKNILVLFNNPNEQLPGQNKLKFTYDLQLPLNAPVFLEQFPEGEARDYGLWNSFVATQRVGRFIPQESNNAGAFATEQKDRAYIGNYVWNDVNYNGRQDEGEPFTDSNGRTLLKPTKDLDYDGTIDDPGINGVKVTLLSPKGYNVDYLGNQIAQVAGDWVVVDDSGAPVLDEVFSKPIPSEGPLVTETEQDTHGHDGYYTFSNIRPGDYRVMFEFPQDYDRFSATTREVFKNTGVSVFTPGVDAGIPAATNVDALVTITDVANVSSATTDAERMSFDMGVAHTVKVGGTIFKEQLKSLDGYQGAGEPGIKDYYVTLKNAEGEIVVDELGNKLVTRTDTKGEYEFTVLPTSERYTVEVTDENNAFNTETVVSPFIHNVDPFAAANDNDGFTPRGETVVKTNPFTFDLQQLVTSKFEDRIAVSVGFYDKSTFGVIGNRVWDDRNRDGIQDADEPGIAGQKLRLEQYIRDGDDWSRSDYTQATTSNADGYYYFREVPSVASQNGVRLEARYEVVIDDLVTGYTFAKTLAGAGEEPDAHERDSDFFKNGTMHKAAVGDHLVSVVDTVNGIDYGLTDNTVDLGLVKHARSSLSGEVFIDTDGDGVQNDKAQAEQIYTATLEVSHEGTWVPARQDVAGLMIEPALAAETDDVMAFTDITSYVFENLHIIDNEQLAPYEYRVKVTSIPLWQEVTKLQRGTDPERDSDFTQFDRGAYNTAVSDVRVLGELRDADQLLPIETFDGVAAEHVDLGLVPLATRATLGDYIWFDANRNGIQDDDEEGVADLTVVLNRLVDGQLVPVTETDTDASGRYEFTVDVADTDPASATFNEPHEYVTQFNMTSRESLAPYRAGSDETLDSNVVKLGEGASKAYQHSIHDPDHTAVSDVVTLVTADERGNARFETTADHADNDGGIIVHDTVRVLGDTLFEDLNRDGVQTADEPGIGGLQVNLYRLDKDTGRWEAHRDLDGKSSMVSDAAGTYSFTLEVADLDKASPHYRQAEEYRVLVEAPAHLRLVEVDNVFFYAEDMVDGNGNPNYAGIDIAKPFSYVLTEAITLVESVDGSVVLTSARDVLSADAGFVAYDTSVTIGGVIWEDDDFDGLQGASELGFPGRTVSLWELIDGVWTPVKDLHGVGSQKTDETGRYSFEVSPTHYEEGKANFLQPREYRVTTERFGYESWSPLNVGDDATIDSDVSAAEPEFGDAHTGVTRVFAIADHPGGRVDVTSVRDDLEMDMGVKIQEQLARIGGVVWEDENEDGLRQEAESVRRGQQVSLWELVDSEWVSVADIQGNSELLTDAQGHYEFEVFATEYDLASDGYLKPREYRVSFEREGFESWSPLNVGDDTSLDSDVAASAPEFGTVHTGVSHVFSIVDSENGRVDISTVRDDLEMDAGMRLHENLAVIGGVVWEDANEDGIQEEGEAARAGQLVSLWERVDGEWASVSDNRGNAELRTDEHGSYEFEVYATDYDHESDGYLKPREYRVSTEREGFESWSPLNAGDDTTLDSDVAASVPEFGTAHTGVTHLFSIVDAEDGLVDIKTVRDDVEMDMGLKTHEQLAVIGGVVWEDTNEDGVQQRGEPLRAGQNVTLWELIAEEWQPVEDARGNQTQETDAQGRYEFQVYATDYDPAADGYLQPREYRASIEREGYETLSPLNVGDDTTLDSDVSASAPGLGGAHTGATHEFSIVDAQDGVVDIATVRDDVEMDMGLKTHEHLAIIGGVVWDDANEDGEHQKDEQVLAGEKVTLWERVAGEWTIVEDNRGNSTQVTDAKGFYEFEVDPTHYDADSAGYLQPREYRTTVQTPRGYALSAGSVTAVLDNERATSQRAQIATLSEAGRVDISDIHDDRTLSYPFTQVPSTSGLAITGSEFGLGLGVLGGMGVLLGLAAVYLSMRRQRERNEGKAS